MDDDDFFGGPSQGGVSDPLTEGEYNRIVTRYTDVRAAEAIRIFSSQPNVLLSF